MVTVVSLKHEHLDELMKIEEDCFSVPWSKESFEGEIKNPLANYLIALEDDKVKGYMGMWKVVDELHITNIAISDDVRRKGVASKLLSKAIDFGKNESCVAMTLEVRPSNEPAIGLYKKYDFEEAARRKAYYSNPTEDALIMWKQLI